jgi:hypothetical protein
MKKEKVNLNQFKEIKIVSTGYTRPGYRTAEDEVNKFISEGWELLETYTTCYSNTPPLNAQQEVHFVLGREETAQDCQFFTTPRPA